MPCMADGGAMLAPTCEEMARDLDRERERMAQSIQDMKAAHAMLEAIIHAGESLVARTDC